MPQHASAEVETVTLAVDSVANKRLGTQTACFCVACMLTSVKRSL